MALIYLIRHGKPASAWGGDDDDPGLDAVGHAQAGAARDWLLAQPSPPRRVVSSPLRRCRETAQPTADALSVLIDIDPRVGEIPTPRGLSAADRPAWLRQTLGGTWAEVEGDLDYAAWREEIVASLVARGDTAVFSHYVAINAVASYLMGDDRVLSVRPDHASITVLETDGKVLKLIALGAEAVTGVL